MSDQDERVDALIEAPWEPCTTCGEVRPVFMRLAPNDAPYCRPCGAHRLELEVFPTPLEAVPVVRVEDEGGTA